MQCHFLGGKFRELNQFLTKRKETREQTKSIQTSSLKFDRASLLTTQTYVMGRFGPTLFITSTVVFPTQELCS